MTRNTTAKNRIQWSVLGTVLLILGALIGYWLYVEHGEIKALEGDRLQVQARVIDENLRRQLEGVNNALAGVRDDFALAHRMSTGPTASRRLKALSNAMPGVRAMGVFDAGGTTLASSQEELIGRNLISEREFFKIPRARPEPDVLYVSPPFRSVVGVHSINLVRAVIGPGGEFAGIVAATIEPGYFVVLLRSVLYAPDMRVALVHGDGKVFLFVPENERVVGIDVATPDTFFWRHRESGRVATLLVDRSVSTGDERLMASRTLDRAGLPMDKPLSVHVSRNLAAIYLPWRKQALAYGVFYGLFAVVALLGLQLQQRRRRSFELAAAQREKTDRLLRHFFDLPFVGMAVISPGTKHWLQFNDCLCGMLGYSRGELARTTWAQLTHPEDLDKDLAEFERVLRGQSEGYAMDKRFIRKDGAVVFTTIDIKCTRNADGTVAYLVAMVQDITERKRKEEEYHGIIQASTDGFWITDFSGRILEVNAAVCRMLGYSKDELLRMGISDIEAEESPAQIAERIRRIVSAGSDLFQGRHRRKDGTVIDVEVSVVCAASLGERFFAFVRDVTERQRAESALKSSEDKFRKAFYVNPDSININRLEDGLYVSINRGFTQVMGYTEDEIIGRSSIELNIWDDPKDRARLVEGLKKDGAVANLEARFRAKDGSIRYGLMSAAVIEIESVPHIISITRDMSERRQADAVRAQLEAQLRESQKMEALGTLAGGVAHDFNNIIAAIMGNVELARQDVGPEHVALESLEEIRKAGRRAKELVQQILAFGRRQKALRRVIALAPVVEESMRLLRTTLPAGVSLTAECEPNVPDVSADPTQVEQVLLNLCSNAWQAIQSSSRPGAIKVLLQAHEREVVRSQDTGFVLAYGDTPPGRYACLTVRDNGSGMDKETLAHIFEPFFTTKPVDQGTGLGLAVVHGIVQEHGASIEVRSVPGEGSVFSVYFPAATASEQAVQARTACRAPAHGQGKRVLFVDDDESIVVLMTRLLERQGYRVSGYTDARAALAAARADPGRFDLAVTDYNMPGISGLDVARELREIRADLPIAVASGYITEELRALAPAAGVSELIYKPDTMDELCEAVARLAQVLPA